MLRDFEDIEHPLCCDALDVIAPNLPAQPS
jgi:hypothetical protein